MFRGRYEHQLDPKGRLALPAAFRRALGDEGTLVIAAHISSPCLVAHPIREWEQFELRLSQLPQFDRNVMLLRRLYVGSAMDCPIDRQGRVLVPPVLRAHAGLEREVYWVGGMKTAEIWAKAAWDEGVESMRAEVDDTVLSKLGDLGI
jgi:MraZ protein